MSFARSEISSTLAKRSSDIPTKLEKLKPKPGQLRRYSTCNSTIQLSEPARNSPLKTDKTKPKPNQIRRYSTGNSTSQISESNTPHYLRSSSINSSRDCCKYGKKHDSKTTLKPPRTTTRKDDQNAAKEEKSSFSDKNYRGKKAISSVSSELKPKPKPKLKPKPLAVNHGFNRQSSGAEKQPKKPFLKSSNNVRVNKNDSRIGKSSKLMLNPSSSISVKVPSPKSSPRKVLNLEIENCVEKSGTDKVSHVENENVPSEKIIHVIQATGDDEDRNEFAIVVSWSPGSNQDQEMDSTVEEENDSSPGSLEYAAEEVEIENGDNSGDPGVKDLITDEEIMNHDKNDGEAAEMDDGEINGGATAKEKELDSDEEIVIHKENDDLRHQATETKSGKLMIEEAARKLIEIRKNKVLDLVAAFERLIHNQDSESAITTIS